MDIPPSQTIYLNNLYEKLTKDGEDYWYKVSPVNALTDQVSAAFARYLSPALAYIGICRASEMLVRYVLSVWKDHRRCLLEDDAATRAGMDRVHRCSISDQRVAHHARVPVL